MTSAMQGIVAGVLAIALGSYVAVLGDSGLILLLACMMFAIGFIASSGEGAPRLLRPTFAIFLASGLGTLAGVTLPTVDQRDFLWLKLGESAGFALGLTLVFTPKGHTRLRALGARLAKPTAMLGMVAATAAVIFFVWQGVPALGDDVESGRVAASGTGTGYLRLLAYMLVPVALVLAAKQHRHVKWVVILAAVVILGMANRSPLLYLLGPILGMMALTSSRVKSRHLMFGGLLLALLVVSIGTYRVMSQEAFRGYAEYSRPLAEGDVLEVARISALHYVEVVPQNAVLTKAIVDSGRLGPELGLTYLTPLMTALPGEQLSLDRRIKELSSATFVGGGTPPTLAGEAYVNFGPLGLLLVPALFLGLARTAFSSLQRTQAASAAAQRIAAVRYSYLLLLICGAQVAGVAGASTFPLTGLAVLYLLSWSETGGGKGSRRNSECSPVGRNA